MEPHSFDNLGGKVRIPDPRDHLIGSAAVGGYTFPATFIQQKAWDAPIYYQGKRPACGAHAGAWLRMFLNHLDGTNPTETDTPRYIWANIKRDGTSPSDGTDMLSIFKALQTYGAAPFEPLENDVTYDDADYAAVKFITPAMVAAGQKNPIASYAFPQDISFNGIKQTIHDFGHALLLINVNNRFWTAANGTTSWLEKDILPLAPHSAAYPNTSAHFIVAHSYDPDTIYFANSFGPWGMTKHPGHGYFEADYMPEVLEIGVGHNPAKIVVSIPTVIPTPIQTVQQELPQVQKAISNLDTLAPAQKAATVSLAQQILQKILQLLGIHS